MFYTSSSQQSDVDKTMDLVFCPILFFFQQPTLLIWKEPWKLEKWLSGKDILLIYTAWVRFPVTVAGCSHLPVTPALRDAHTNTQACMHMYVQIKVLVNK